MRQARLLLVITVGLAVGVAGCATPKRSTAEERSRIVAISKQYEADILAPEAKTLATEIVQWWGKVPDLRVNWCSNLLTDEEPGLRERVGAFSVQALASAGVFVIENPSRASDNRAVWIAGLEGVVRAYHHSGRNDAFLDKLSELQASDKLGEYVDAHSTSCH